MNIAWVNALWGGLLIGFAVSLMLLFNGRVTGISGIFYGLIKPVSKDLIWRVYFIAGLVIGGVTLQLIKPEVFSSPLLATDWRVVLAGMLVGFGTVLGSGCTSGHGICGISRLSLRSIVATITFILAGVLAVAVLS